MRAQVEVSGAAGTSRALRAVGTSAERDLVASLNRTARDFRARVLTKTTDVYNISRRELAKYVSTRDASPKSLEASVSLRIRAIPIEVFKPRVQMQSFSYQVGDNTVTRLLPAIYLQRLKAEAPKYVGPAFPLQQRRSGELRAGERVRRRLGNGKTYVDPETGQERDSLTKLRYYTFPREFVEEVILPDAAEFIPSRVELEIRRAIRRDNGRLRQPR